MVAVGIEEPPVVLRIVVEGIARQGREVFDQQAPVLVFLSKVDGAIYGLHALFLQPGFRSLEEQGGDTVVIDGLEEADAPGGLLHAAAVGAHEGRNSSAHCPFSLDKPTLGDPAFLEEPVLFRIEDRDVLLQVGDQTGLSA